MLHKKLKLTILFLLVFELTLLNAQTSINTTGGNASGSGGSTSYSIGQMVYSINTGTYGSVLEGVQQPFEISIVTAIEESIGINLSFIAFPNPTSDFITLRISDFDNSNLFYQLYDINGKLLQTKKTSGIETQIDMSGYVPATYFLRVISENKSIKEFKIIKN